MSYLIDSGIWSSVFAVPTAVVDDHIKMCSPLSLKILLLMLRHSGTPVDVQWLSERLCIPAGDIADAVNYWVGAGIVRESGAAAKRLPARPAPDAVTAPVLPAPAVKEEASGEGQRVVTISARQKISRADIAVMEKADVAIGELLREAQNILGAPLTPVESEILVALHSYYGLDTGAVLMLLQYCVESGHRSMNYLERTAAAWMERGISSHEQVEQEIVRLTRSGENEKKVVKAFGIYSRSLTSKERGYVERWFSLGLDEKLIFLACERAVENTGKVSFAYADKILSSWKTKGIATVKAAVEDLSAGSARRAATQNKSAQTGRDSSLDMDKLHALLHRQADD